jgi:dipeptidyl-peptidase-4
MLSSIFQSSSRFGIYYLLLLFSLCAGTADAIVSPEDIAGGKFKPEEMPLIRFLPDGEHFAMLSRDRSTVLKCACRTGKVVDTLFSTKKARECAIESVDGYLIGSTGFRIVLWTNTAPAGRRSWQADVYDYDVRRNLIKPLSDRPGKLMLPLFSPDGRMCAFVRDNNIWLKKFDYDTESPVTKDGSAGKILNGQGGWLYEEAFDAEGLMSWSPDSRTLAFVRIDEAEVPDFSVQRFDGSLYPATELLRYPKAGEKNPAASVHAYSVDTRDIKRMNLPIAPDDYIPAIKFTANPDQLAVMTLNRQQNIFRMYYAHPKSTVARMILKDESSTYIDHRWLRSMHFTENNFVYVSESGGYAHIYLYSPTGILQKQLTSGSSDVTALLGIDPATMTVYYESAGESPLRRAVCSVDGKGKVAKLSPGAGCNHACFNERFTYYLNNYSTASVPDRVSMCSRDGKELYVLTDNRALQSALSRQKTVAKEFCKIATPDGGELNAWIVKPLDFDASRQYPAVLLAGGSPGSQQVLDRFDAGWEQLLASRGFVVACVDVRGTGARGDAFRKCVHLQPGIPESDDQAASARWIGRLPYVDKNRIAIWGRGYGGTVALMAMSRGEGVFRAGIAIAPVADWRLYNSACTERLLRTPNENPDGYRQASPVAHAGSLQGRLLLVHGAEDDNVHLQHTIYYVRALVEASRQFDMQIYPGRDPGMAGSKTRLHLYTRCCEFLERELNVQGGR